MNPLLVLRLALIEPFIEKRTMIRELRPLPTAGWALECASGQCLKKGQTTEYWKFNKIQIHQYIFVLDMLSPNQVFILG